MWLIEPVITREGFEERKSKIDITRNNGKVQITYVCWCGLNDHIEMTEEEWGIKLKELDSQKLFKELKDNHVHLNERFFRDVKKWRDKSR